jgi:hypothetical protein
MSAPTAKVPSAKEVLERRRAAGEFVPKAKDVFAYKKYARLYANSGIEPPMTSVEEYVNVRESNAKVLKGIQEKREQRERGKVAAASAAAVAYERLKPAVMPLSEKPTPKMLLRKELATYQLQRELENERVLPAPRKIQFSQTLPRGM